MSTVHKNDEEIILDYLNGNNDAYTEIVDRYLKQILNFIYRLIGDQKEAEDITQDVFLKSWKNIRKFNPEKSFRTWIFSIAKNASIDYLRKKKEISLSSFDTDDGNMIEESLEDEELKPDEIFEINESKSEIEKSLNSLSITQKQVLFLKYMNEMSLAEIAEVIKIPLDTVKSHHRRAIAKLRKVHPKR